MASEYIKTLYGGDGLVASVEIDAASGGASAVNARVGNVSARGDAVSYLYAPAALPMPVDASYQTADGRYANVDFTEKMNREIIKISNLASGSYTVTFGQTVVGTFTDAELAQGVNIAALNTNPGQIQAQGVLDLNIQKYNAVTSLRNLASNIWTLRQAKMYEGKTDAEIEAWIGANQQATNYFIYRAQESAWKATVASSENQARALAQPNAYEVAIAKQN
jgi:hypothetical protein